MAESIKTRYERLAAERTSFLDRARLCSKVTIPSLIPPDGFNGTTNLDTPFQSVGANGVNSLSSQLLLTLMPPNAPFFRLQLDDFRFGELGDASPQIKQETDDTLAKLERRIMLEIELAKIRMTMSEGLRHVLVAGNVLLYVPKEGPAKYFPLSKFVLDKDPLGNLMEIIIHEEVDPLTLPVNQYALGSGSITGNPMSQGPADFDKVDDKGQRKNWDLFTHVQRTGPKKFKVTQELNGMELEGSRGSYIDTELPYLHIPYQPVEGSPYGRGLVEEYLGDLLTAEGLSQAIVEGSLAAARTLNLVKPNAVVRMKDLNEAPNGAYVYGNEGDVSRLQSEAAIDLRIARETLGDVLTRLSGVFLLHQSVRREAERVTAEEIRYMAQQLENNLGGVYSVLSQALQMPLITIMLGRLRRAGLIGKINDKVIHPVVVTGLEALGRGNDLNRLDVFIGSAVAVLKDQLFSYMNVGEYLRRRATALGIEVKGLVYTEEEMQQRQAQQQQTQIVSDVAPVVAKEAMSSATKTGS